MFLSLHSVFANVKIPKSTKMAKPKPNVAPRSDSLTYLFTSRIVVEALAKRILNI